MSNTVIFPLGTTSAVQHCVRHLAASGVPISPGPGSGVTHLLLDVPSFRPNAQEYLSSTISRLSPQITVIGGNLDQAEFSGLRCLDLLKKEDYLCRNAMLTAHCALKFAMPLLSCALYDTPTLIIGWGRIGKCLAKVLRDLNCPVTIAVRGEKDRCLLRSLGYRTTDPGAACLRDFRLIFNTAPEPVFGPDRLDPYPDLIKIDLASRPGLTGSNIHTARGLPGLLAPESSGKLIAQAILTYLKEEKP